jgi:hypothetical protein
MPKKKPDSEKAKKVSVSIPRADWELVEMRLLDWRCGPSEYIQRLIRDDTQPLWLAKNTTAISQLKIAAETPESVDLPQDKTKGKYQNAAKTKAAARAGVKMISPSQSFGGSSSTPTTDHSLKTGSQK